MTAHPDTISQTLNALSTLFVTSRSSEGTRAGVALALQVRNGSGKNNYWLRTHVRNMQLRWLTTPGLVEHSVRTTHRPAGWLDLTLAKCVPAFVWNLSTSCALKSDSWFVKNPSKQASTSLDNSQLEWHHIGFHSLDAPDFCFRVLVGFLGGYWGLTQEAAPILRARDLPLVSSFLIKALRDDSETVRATIMAAGQTVSKASL